ncbi:MAG: hypothetical protein Fur0024_0760 [Patescibacteria group bacterium]
MDISNYFTKFLIALLVGVVTGIERETKKVVSHETHNFGGIRTYSMISIVGFFFWNFIFRKFS